ncbi:glycoside hydrolase family 5 protein [Jaapia argillacea MUCL 33604]|uniref:cellulase n=1 Tax=Jaapia argillacea MUCL 33604 TaxID=933084 RepID=A0A067PJS8_9AGAM|nr:glycoside hydrolase family 5 protein [Jaapia argillacea MUCL 33604]
MKTVYALGFIGLTVLSARGQAVLYGQCGGLNWTGATTCVAGAVCTYSNAYYSQCLPASSSSSSTHSTTTTSSSHSTTTTSTSHTTTTTTTSAAPTTTGTGSGSLQFYGVNIAGFDFGCDTSGDCTASGAYPPLTVYYGADGAGQMSHFCTDDGYNIFRLPVSWQFLTNNTETGVLNPTDFAEYNTLVQDCLSTGAYCIIDLHNYARYNGAIIGQGGPSNEIFAQLWGNIAAYYASESKIIFGVMNEPHDLNVTLWAGTVQAAVTAIRNANATTQIILLPGDNYTSAATIWSDGSGAALLLVTNPDGTTTNLIFDNSGTSDVCVTNNISEAWEPLSAWLRTNGRQALNSETGGGNTASCVTYMCQQIAYLKTNASDVILGYVGWAAGNFATTYVLSETPTDTNGVWTDTELVSSCMAPK